MDSIPIYRHKSGPEADFDLDGWDWAGAWLDIWGESWTARAVLDLGQMPIKFDRYLADQQNNDSSRDCCDGF